jgi:hypothetical protein
MFKEVTVILLYDGEYIQKVLFRQKNIGGFEVSALFFGHAWLVMLSECLPYNSKQH